MRPDMTVKLDMHSKARIQHQIRKGGSDALMAVAFFGEGYAKQRMGPSPSSPDDFPGVDTGNLRAGILAVDIAPDRKELVSSALYSVYLEYGTLHTAPRPFMLPTAREMGKRAPRIVATVIGRHIR